MDVKWWLGGVWLAVFAFYWGYYGLWSAVTVLLLCVLCVTAGRLLQSVQRELRRLSAPLPRLPSSASKNHARCVKLAKAVSVAIVVQAVLSPLTPGLLLDHWYLAVMAPLLALAFELGGTSRSELAETLSNTQTSYAEGAAWGFYLGYLLKGFGDDMGKHFRKRMEDYLAANGVSSDESQSHTCLERMFILVPMNLTAMLSDNDFHRNDTSVKKEKSLDRASEEGGRKYGETQVYLVNRDGYQYRLAMEEASPLIHAACAVDDADADFNETDFEAFARHFLAELQKILDTKPAIGEQLEVVPIYDSAKLGGTVVERLLKR